MAIRKSDSLFNFIDSIGPKAGNIWEAREALRRLSALIVLGIMCTWIFFWEIQAFRINLISIKNWFLRTVSPSKVMAEVVAKEVQIALPPQIGTWFYLYLHQHTIQRIMNFRDTLNLPEASFLNQKQRRPHTVKKNFMSCKTNAFPGSLWAVPIRFLGHLFRWLFHSYVFHGKVLDLFP